MIPRDLQIDHNSGKPLKHSGHPPPPFLQGGVEPPTKFSKRGGGVLTGPQLLEGFWKRGGDFFQKHCHFHIKIN